MQSGGIAAMAFARGFLLTETRVPQPVAGWIESRVGDLNLWRDPRTPLRMAQAGDRWVAILGHFVDVRRPLDPEDDVLAACAGYEPAALLAETDHWSGRFVCLFGGPDGCAIAPDAIGSKPLYYSLDAPFVAGSHAALVARIADAAPNPEIAARLSRRAMYGLPGDYTIWRRVHVLTPNQTLDPATRQPSRFWPRGDIAEMSVEEAAQRVADIMTATMDGLTNRRRPVLFSLTAGLDSRLSLAASRRHVDSLECFTFSNGDHHRIDMEFALSAAPLLGLSHRPLETGLRLPRETREEFEAVMTEISPRNHFRRGSYAYTLNYPQHALHVRSSAGEIGRSFFRDPAKCFVPKTTNSLVSAWGGDAADRKVDLAAFADWTERSRYWSVQQIDLLDLFHWEHRMGTWLSELCLESDIAFDTHIMFSCRALLEAFVSAPLAERRVNKVFYASIHRMWPHLLALPINGEKVAWP
tara:strand:+ start:11429 stop:12835 length:1407 start_codon:yes stop_codon:yes gene_type:complete